ncbi:GNAT family N-acetyltransferase [Paraburkholderia heleia]|uniref:GNAT family N-acetyltransferase n=1 Tax=Paraburkholderia heleia TaxID=634127 RepID=UPI0005A947B7|nr:GNAT family N-acetyltransferase [Paraburkholderia heleia]
MKNLGITLRAATPADEPFLFDLRKATMDEHLRRAGEPTDERTHWERLRYRYNDSCIVCCRSEEIGLFKSLRDEDEWAIVQIQILPTHQGRGIGAHLVREFLQLADVAGVPVKLSVLKGNPAIHLYHRLGFRVTKTTDTSLQMRRG